MLRKRKCFQEKLPSAYVVIHKMYTKYGIINAMLENLCRPTPKRAVANKNDLSFLQLILFLYLYLKSYCIFFIQIIKNPFQ